MKTLKDQIVEQINELSTSDLVSLNNTYASENSIEGEIYENDEYFFNTFFDGKVLEAIRAVSFGEYTYSHDYVQFNGYGNLESINYVEVSDLCELPEVIAEYAIENQNEFYMLDFAVELEEETEA